MGQGGGEQQVGSTPKTSNPWKDPPGAALLSRVLPNCWFALLEVWVCCLFAYQGVTTKQCRILYLDLINWLIRL